MRLMLGTIVIFIMTCTSNVYRLLEGEIAFVIDLSPHWSDLFTLYPLSVISWGEFAGHFFMFFILTGLLLSVFNSISSAVVIASLYGIGTELLQPFFGRGAEGVDLLANTVGIVVFVMLYGVVKISFVVGRKKAAALENKHIRDVL